MRRRESQISIVNYLLIVLLFALPFIINAFKLSKCDFVEPYRCEMVHGAGLVVPPASWVTVWFGVDGPV